MAIIVVLAAVAIPTFGKQLETAREANDAEAIRAVVTDAFTEAYMAYMNTGALALKDGDSDKLWPATAQSVTFKQTKTGFNYVSPTYTVGEGTVTLAGTVPVVATNANTAGAQEVQISFAVATNPEAGIKITSIKIGDVTVNAGS